MYMQVSDFDKIFNTTNYYNVSYINFKDSLTTQQKESAVEAFCNKANLSVSKSTVLENSEAYKTFERVTKALINTVTYLPILIMFLTFICVFLFIRQVITRAYALQNLLSRLGYKISETRKIFINYILLVFVGAIVLGGLASIFVIYYFSQICIDSYNLPYFKFAMD